VNNAICSCCRVSYCSQLDIILNLVLVLVLGTLRYHMSNLVRGRFVIVLKTREFIAKVTALRLSCDLRVFRRYRENNRSMLLDIN